MKYFLSVPLLLLLSCETPGERAHAGASAWAAQLYPGAEVRISCTAWDSDGDGYVSCAIVIKEGTQTKLLSVECASGYALTQGCRFPKPQVPGERER